MADAETLVGEIDRLLVINKLSLLDAAPTAAIRYKSKFKPSKDIISEPGSSSLWAEANAEQLETLRALIEKTQGGGELSAEQVSSIYKELLAPVLAKVSQLQQQLESNHTQFKKQKAIVDHANLDHAKTSLSALRETEKQKEKCRIYRGEIKRLEEAAGDDDDTNIEQDNTTDDSTEGKDDNMLKVEDIMKNIESQEQGILEEETKIQELQSNVEMMQTLIKSQEEQLNTFARVKAIESELAVATDDQRGHVMAQFEAKWKQREEYLDALLARNTELAQVTKSQSMRHEELTSTTTDMIQMLEQFSSKEDIARERLNETQKTNAELSDSVNKAEAKIIKVSLTGTVTNVTATGTPEQLQRLRAEIERKTLALEIVKRQLAEKMQEKQS